MRLSDMEKKGEEDDNSKMETPDYGVMYWKHLLKDVKSSSNEVYAMCLSTSNLSACKEMILNYQQLTYDFLILLEHLENKEQGHVCGEPNRTKILTSRKEGVKIEMGINESHKRLKVTECSTQTEHHLHSEKSQVGVNVLAPVFVPSYPLDGEEPRKGCPHSQHDVSEESMTSCLSPYLRSSPGLLSSPFTEASFSDYHPRSLWHLPSPQSYTQFQHYHVGSNFIPGAPLPFPPMSGVLPSHYPPTNIYSSNMHSYPAACHYNNSYQNQNLLPSYQPNNNLYEEKQNESTKCITLKTNIRNSRHKTIGENIKIKKPVNNLLSTLTNDKKLSNVNLDSIDNLKEDTIKRSSVQSGFNKQMALSEQTPNTCTNMSPTKVINSQERNSSDMLSNSLKTKEANNVQIFELTEAEHQKQFPELRADNSLLKKHRNKFPKVKYQKKNIYSFDDFTSYVCQNLENQQWFLDSTQNAHINGKTPPVPPLPPPPRHNIMPRNKTRSVVAEKNRMNSNGSSGPRFMRENCPPRFRKSMHFKREGGRRNNHENTRLRKEENGNKSRIQNYWQQNHWGSKKKFQADTMEDGWQTVRYKTRDYTLMYSPSVNSQVIEPVHDEEAVQKHKELNDEMERISSNTDDLNNPKDLVSNGIVNNLNDSLVKDCAQTSDENDFHEANKANPDMTAVDKDFDKAVQMQINDPMKPNKNEEDMNSSKILKEIDNFNHPGPSLFDSTAADLSLNLDLSALNYQDKMLEGYSEEEHSESTDTNSPGQLVFSENNAKDMYSEFMEYLSCITWAAQMDEIEHFATLLSVDSPHSFIDSYSSPSIEHFEEFLLCNADRALEFRSEIANKHKRLKDTEEKQQQAYEKRQQLLQCKTAKVREFVQKVEEVRASKYKLALQMKSQIDQKLKKAEENRKLHLSIIKRKAHDEEEKLKEIAFINELEAQNRRHDSLVLRQEHEERIQYIIEERQRKVEEKAAKDAAVEERRRVIEAERQAKLQEMSEKRKKKEEIIDRKQQEKEKERQEIAREKAREREERLLARQAAQLANAEELQKRIQQKQEESARRHEENIELIRQKALEVGLHKTAEDTLTSASLKTEDQKDTGESHHYSYNELIPTFKKRCKKIRLRMTARGTHFVQSIEFAKPERNCKTSHELNELDVLVCSTFNDKSFGLINQRLMSLHEVLKQEASNSTHVFSYCKGFLVCSDLIKKGLEVADQTKNSSGLVKSLQTLIVLLDIVCKQDFQCLRYLMCSNDIALFLDLLQLSFMKQKLKKKRDEWILLARMLANFILQLFNDIKKCQEADPVVYSEFANRIPDLVSYFICSGIVHNIIDLLRVVVIDGLDQMNSLVAPSIYMFSVLLDKQFYSNDLRTLLKATDCLETVYLLCESLQKMSATNAKYLPGCAHPIITMLLKFAIIDITLFQEILGAEGMALQIRSIASIIMTFCNKNPHPESLILVMIQLIGYFSIGNPKNQAVLQSGQQPTVLQLLVSLPFKYFCSDCYMVYLFPTLLACTHENPVNKAIVESELSYSTLEKFGSSQEPGVSKLLDLFYGRNVESKSTRKRGKKSRKNSADEQIPKDIL
ncbi:uncharacterized protein LOC106667205 isoform X2 [Cimex lectularius]|uniref:S phase cyclin A-associated protein in the endoplasmic reticulum N-terminal domain-containing protein n=1 Tax=Cimex lectularius TaxID=79782 RepID=A0A8I6RZ06_CIMLE|nr:uncharacterized protein LOC106667205 isoform X2 [Cimex lectularius]